MRRVPSHGLLRDKPLFFFSNPLVLSNSSLAFRVACAVSRRGKGKWGRGRVDFLSFSLAIHAYAASHHPDRAKRGGRISFLERAPPSPPSVSARVLPWQRVVHLTTRVFTDLSIRFDSIRFDSIRSEVRVRSMVERSRLLFQLIGSRFLDRLGKF